jgi:TPR repeat protein
MSVIMSDRIANSPTVDQLAVNFPTSQGQTDAQLAASRATELTTSEPTLSNKEAPKSPLDPATVVTIADSSSLSHTAPERRSLANSDSSSSAVTNVEDQSFEIKSIEVLKIAADLGDVVAQFDLGESYYYGDGVELDLVKGLHYFKLAAEHGDVDAQFNLGIIYLEGEVVAKNLSNALIFFQAAAAQGHSEAQYNLGLMYFMGDGVPKDDHQAANYFRDSAYFGHADAQCQLGLMYEKGLGIERDESKAFDWYFKAAIQDNAIAQFELGRMYSAGIAVTKDDDQAFTWFIAAAKQGLQSAQLALFSYYTSGPDKQKDLYLASYWLLKSGLQADGKSINLQGLTRISSNFSTLVKLFLDVLVKFPEFEQVQSLQVNYNDVKDENFTSISEFIRSNTTLLTLSFTGSKLKDNDARILAQALDKNSTLITFNYIGEIDESIEDQILNSLEQNKLIPKLRRYMLDHPIKRSDILPLEVLDIMVDKIIVAYLKSGHSFEYTKTAVEEYLVSVAINSVSIDLKN